MKLTRIILASALGAMPQIVWAQTPLLNCSVKPSEVIEISSVLSGVVAEVLVKRGEHVEWEASLDFDERAAPILACGEHRLSLAVCIHRTWRATEFLVESPAYREQRIADLLRFQAA